MPKSASEYANENYEGAIEAVKQFDNAYHFTKEQLDTVKLGEPFVVNDINMESQIEIYYYPILDDSDRVIFLLSVVNTSYGWSHSISEEWVSGLNTIGQITPDFVFYKSEENLYAENQNNIYVVQGSDDVHIKFYSLKDYSEKKEDVYKTVDNFKEVDYYDCTNSFYNVKAGYTPSFSSSTGSSKICALYNKKNQGNVALCWAASVATICNYRNGTNITPIQIANAMGVGINDGASTLTSQKALKNNGVTYNVLNANSSDLMSWSVLKSNINSKYPVYVVADAANSKMAHAVTVYGYTVAAGVNYIILWNSGDNNGSGGVITAAFKSSGTAFGYDGKTYIWKKSLSKY